MKKQTAMALAAVFAMSVAGTALAAPANPFSDVPAKHWAYDSVNKLAKAGVISGYGDGTFKGDKTLTRYEIAVIVGKALANSDKADAASQKELEALKAEFGVELNNLGVRVDNLEKNASKVKFTGEVRERYEYAKDSKDGDKTDMRTRVRISMTAPIADNVTFKGRLHSESEWGNADGNNTVVLDQAYITGKLSGLEYSFGRQPILLGQKLLVNFSQNNDGLVLSGGTDVKLTGGAYKNGAANYKIGNVNFKLSDKLNVTASYLGDDNDGTTNKYDSTSAGFKYSGLGSFTVTGEYGQNDADAAKSANSNEKSKAWASRLQYLGAKADKVNSYGMWVSYRRADAGFDPSNWNDFTDMATWNGGFKEMDNIKGLDFGVEYAIFKNGILRAQYNDMKDEKTGKIDKRNMFAELIYTF